MLNSGAELVEQFGNNFHLVIPLGNKSNVFDSLGSSIGKVMLRKLRVEILSICSLRAWRYAYCEAGKEFFILRLLVQKIPTRVPSLFWKTSMASSESS